MPNPPIVKPDVKKVDYNYSWPVPNRKPKNAPKPATDKQVSDKTPVKSRINRTTV